MFSTTWIPYLLVFAATELLSASKRAVPDPEIVRSLSWSESEEMDMPLYVDLTEEEEAVQCNQDPEADDYDRNAQCARLLQEDNAMEEEGRWAEILLLIVLGGALIY